LEHLHVDRVRIEAGIVPLGQFAVALVVRISNGFEELGISRRAAA